ncbi:MAG TPA: ion channel, partial [Bryobacteraceae bacterium]|nr:ion channel [Bryobacteraceae bacterium]
MDIPANWAWLEQTAGALITAVVLTDVFLTVLYARMGYSIVADLLAQLVWSVFFHASKLFGRHRPLLLSFGGPVIVVAVVAFWVFALICGSAMVVQPELGRALQSSTGATPRGFVSAVYVAGSNIITVGSSGVQPKTGAFRLFCLFDSIIGMSLVTLTVTYIVEIYNALHSRNTLALKLHVMSAKTGDAADFIAALGASGEFGIAYSILSEAAAEIVSLKESHNFYPVLFYFRFRSPLYSVSMAALMALDTATLLGTALNEKRHGWLKRAAAVIALRESAELLINTLQETFLPKRSPEANAPDENDVELWRGRYFAALGRLREAGLETR